MDDNDSNNSDKSLLDDEELYEVDETRGPATTEDSDASGERRIAEKRPLAINYLFNSPTRRTLIDFFITVADEDETFSNSALARESGLGRRSVVEHVDVLEEFGIIYNEASEARPQWSLDTERRTYYAIFEMNDLLMEISERHRANTSVDEDSAHDE